MHVGQKVRFDGMEGYIVGITIDPLEECEVKYESHTYIIRVFKPFYKDGYFDFQRSGRDLLTSWQNDEFRRCCQAKREFERYQKEHNNND